MTTIEPSHEVYQANDSDNMENPLKQDDGHFDNSGANSEVDGVDPRTLQQNQIVQLLRNKLLEIVKAYSLERANKE